MAALCSLTTENQGSKVEATASCRGGAEAAPVLAWQDYNAALTDLSHAAEINPEDKSVKAELARVRKVREDMQRKEKATYARMFS